MLWLFFIKLDGSWHSSFWKNWRRLLRIVPVKVISFSFEKWTSFCDSSSSKRIRYWWFNLFSVVSIVLFVIVFYLWYGWIYIYIEYQGVKTGIFKSFIPSKNSGTVQTTIFPNALEKQPIPYPSWVFSFLYNINGILLFIPISALFFFISFID